MGFNAPISLGAAVFQDILSGCMVETFGLESLGLSGKFKV